MNSGLTKKKLSWVVLAYEQALIMSAARHVFLCLQKIWGGVEVGNEGLLPGLGDIVEKLNCG